MTSPPASTSSASPFTLGTPCWYELGTNDLDAAAAFYTKVFPWSIEKAAMSEMDYRLATSGGDKVAGLMSNDSQDGSPSPNWVIYFVADDCGVVGRGVEDKGGRILVPSTEVPGVGSFAILADPQGAVFGLLAPLPMDDTETQGGAFNQQATGHGHWHELMTTAPEAALAFYSDLFGWRASQALDMGEMGQYQLFSHQGTDIGGMMGLGYAPAPTWLPYFGVDDVAQAMATIKAEGGTVVHGPVEVPGPALIAVALDPQQAAFAIVGPKA